MRKPPAYCPECASTLVEREDGGLPRPACPACAYVFYDNPTPVVAALVEHEGTVVLVQNKGWPETWYGLVSGFLERGETVEHAVLREVKEELGLDGTIISLIGVYTFFRMNQVIIAYHVRARGTIVPGDELAAYKRVAPEHLRPWPMGTGEAVRDWLAMKGFESQTTDPRPRTMTIWHQPITVDRLRQFARGSMVEHLGITFTEVGDDYLKGTMPVDHRTHQPMGLLHGGASVVLAETLGSMAATCCVDFEKQHCVGLEVNANHLRSVRQGTVTGTARPLHVGRRTQVWEVHIHDEADRLVCVSRITLAVVDR